MPAMNTMYWYGLPASRAALSAPYQASFSSSSTPLPPMPAGARVDDT